MQKDINKIIGKSTLLDLKKFQELNIFPEDYEPSSKYEVFSLNAMATINFFKKYAKQFAQTSESIIESIDHNVVIDILANTAKDGVLINESNINSLFNDNVAELYLVTLASAMIHLESAMQKKSFSTRINPNHLDTKAV